MLMLMRQVDGLRERHMAHDTLTACSTVVQLQASQRRHGHPVGRQRQRHRHARDTRSVVPHVRRRQRGWRSAGRVRDPAHGVRVMHVVWVVWAAHGRGEHRHRLRGIPGHASLRMVVMMVMLTAHEHGHELRLKLIRGRVERRLAVSRKVPVWLFGE